MNLQEHLRDCAEASMQIYLENNKVDPESEDDYQKWVDEFMNSEWWDFNLTYLSYHNVQELLGTNQDFCEEYKITIQPDDIETLMRRYGLYWIHQHMDSFMMLWTENLPQV